MPNIPMWLQIIFTALGALVTLFGLVGTIAISVAFFKRTGKLEVIQIQESTITALEQRINAQELKMKEIQEKQEELTRENVRLHQIISAIETALAAHNMKVTYNGEMVIVSNASSGIVSALPHNQKRRASGRPAPEDTKSDE